MALSPVAPLQKPDSNIRSAVSDEKLQQLYTLMAQLRAHKSAAPSAYSKKHGLRYNEACEAAAVIDLQSNDAVSILPDQGINHLARRATPWQRGVSSTLFPWRLIEGGGNDRVAIAAGVACGNHVDGPDRVVIVFATSSDVTHASDSLRFACEQNLPIIYFELTHANVRKSKPTSHRLPTIPVDDSDVVAVYRVAYESIDKARRGAGPTLIQCIKSHRVSTKGRFKDDRADPLLYMEHYLRKRNLWSDDLRG